MAKPKVKGGINSVYGSVVRIDPKVLRLIGWKEYIAMAAKPFPVKLLNELRIKRGYKA